MNYCKYMMCLKRRYCIICMHECNYGWCMNEWQYECLLSTLILQAADQISSAQPGLANIRLSLDVLCRVQLCRVQLSGCSVRFLVCIVQGIVLIFHSSVCSV